MTIEADAVAGDRVGVDDPGDVSVSGPGTATGAAKGNRTVMTVAICFGILMAVFIVLLATSDASTGSLESREIEGQVAPLLSGPTITGETFALEDLRGQWVLVNFFATWCPGCITEHPELVEFSRRRESDGAAQVVSVVFDDSAANVEEFFLREGGAWPVIVDGSTAREFVVEFGVTAVPETYIISPSGRVELKIVSSAGVTADALDRALGLEAG